MTNVSVQIATPEGVIEVRGTVEGERITLDQLDAGSWHWAGDGKVEHTPRGWVIFDCDALFGILGHDVTHEVYFALEEALDKVLL